MTRKLNSKKNAASKTAKNRKNARCNGAAGTTVGG